MTDSTAASIRRPRIPTARPEGIVAGFLLAFLATAGLFYVNIMAAIVDGLVSGLSFSDSQAGNIGSANIYGAAIGALAAVFLVKRAPWRPTAFIALFLLIAIDLLSMIITRADILIAIRLIHGIVGGMLVGVAYAVIARTGKADRIFGVLLFVQFGLGGLGVMTLPKLVPIYGAQALFLALALFGFVTLLMMPFLDRYPPRPASENKTADAISWSPLVLTLVAIFIFQAANMALLAYIIRLGIDFGLDRDYVSTALGLATWVALAGPGAVMLIGIRFGRFWPLAVVMLFTLAGTMAFHFSGAPLIYLLANCGTGITWGMVMAYLLGMAAQFDGAGRTAAAAGFVSKMGLASGPLVAGQLLANGQGFSALINWAFVALAASMVFILVPAFKLDRVAATS